MHLALDVNGRRYVIFVEQLAAISRRSIGQTVGTAKAIEYNIIAALDMLFTGI